jgi:hypothetical protein
MFSARTEIIVSAFRDYACSFLIDINNFLFLAVHYPKKSFPQFLSILFAAQMAEANNDHLIRSADSQHPANLIPELCRKFWTLGWVTGTGGGASIRDK